MTFNKNQSQTIKVTFFGDSTCVGQGVSIYQGWVTKIAQYLDEYGKKINKVILVTNSSTNGRTTRQALEDMPYHIQSQEIDILVLQFGLNDCNYWASDRGLPRVSLPAFLENLREIISRAENCGVRKILLNNNHPTTRDKFIMPGSNITYEASNMKYNEGIRKLTKNLPPSVKFQDIEYYFKEVLLNQQNNCLEDFLLTDGLHLNIFGHQYYYQIMCPMIKEVLDSLI